MLPDPGAQPAPDYPTPVAATWTVLRPAEERSPGAARLLELCAYFSPDPISLKLLYSEEMIESLLPFDTPLRNAVLGG